MGSAVLAQIWAQLQQEKTQTWPLAPSFPQGDADTNLQNLLESLPGLSIGKGSSLEIFRGAFYDGAYS